MDPGIAGTFPPKASKFENRKRANPDGSIVIEIYRLAASIKLTHLTGAVSDGASVIWGNVTLLSDELSSRVEGGERIYTWHIPAGTLHPGLHTIRVHTQEFHDGRINTQESQVSFMVGDTPFNQHTGFRSEA